MNILFLATNYPYPPNSGHNLRTYNILKILSEEHTVHFVTFSKDANKKHTFKNDPVHNYCKTADIFTSPDDLSKFRMAASLGYNLFSCLPYIAQKYYNRNMLTAIKNIINNNKIDLVHFDILHVSRYARIINNIPKALTEHNVESERVKRLAENTGNIFLKFYMYLQYLKLHTFEKKTCGLFDLCIAVSKSDAAELARMNPSAKVIVIPNGVDTDYFKPGAMKPESDSLIWVGGMGDLYNREAIEYFCESIFPRIQNVLPNLKYTFIGDKAPFALSRLAQRFPNIQLAGYVEDIRPYVEAASLFIAPLKSGGGTKLKVLNALSMAKAVVTTSIGAEGIDVIDNEHIAIGDTSEIFAEKVISLVRDPSKAAAMGWAGRELILSKYDWRVIGKLQKEVYSRMITKYKEVSVSDAKSRASSLQVRG